MRLWNRRHLDTWKHRGNTSLANVAQTGEGGPWNGDLIYNEPKELANHWSRLPNLTFREYLSTLMNRFDLVSYDAMAMSFIFCLSFWRLETSYDFNVRYCFDCHHLTVELTPSFTHITITFVTGPHQASGGLERNKEWPGVLPGSVTGRSNMK